MPTPIALIRPICD